MRTDCRIDNVAVPVPNVSCIGYYKTQAKKGCVVLFRDSDQCMLLGRVVGRVNAPEIGDKAAGTWSPEIKNYLCVLVLMPRLTSVGERWVDPATVTNCYDPQDHGGKDIGAMLAWFFSPEFTKQTAHDLRSWASDGWHQFSRFKEEQAKRERMIN